MNVQANPGAEDVAAIRALIHEETDAFMSRDFDRWANCFVHDERTQDVSVMPDRGVLVHRGWKEVAGAMRRIMLDNPIPERTPYEHGDIEVSVDGNMAWATFESTCRAVPEDVYQQHDSNQMRILERHARRWRIVYLGFLALRNPRSLRPIIQLDEAARVIWASNKTLKLLKGFEGLTISAGRLRAAKPRFDKGFQKTVARAADLRHLLDTAYTTRSGNSFVNPYILGEDSLGGVLHCTIFVSDGRVNVSFGDAKLIERKIKAAAEIFGLSPGQSRLSIKIVDGLALPAAAAALGISVNTARTHLARIFEKTGVTSQAALVRILLSVTPFP